MKKKFNTAITIRSFNLQSEIYTKLSKRTNIVFVNTTGQRLKEIDLCKAISDADGIIAGTELYTENILKSAPHLKVLSRVGVGLDNIDLEYTKRKGICVLNTPLAPGDAVAEHTIALIFSIFKRIPQYYEKAHRGDYSIQQGSMISGKIIGIIGLGRIGLKVATLLNACGTKIIFFDPFVKKNIPKDWERLDTLDDLLQAADVISLHSSPQSGNIPVLDKYAFSRCKTGVVVINTARGSLIDEKSLVDALDCGKVSFVGLDVVSIEPYKGPLLKYPQVIITPHVASNTLESRQQMEIEAVENMIHTLGI